MARADALPPGRRHGGVDAGRPERAVFISTRTILLVGVAVALAWAVSSIGHVLLLILVSIFNIAVLLPVVDAMERRLPLSRGMFRDGAGVRRVVNP
jgi:hypothetical protein